MSSIEGSELDLSAENAEMLVGQSFGASGDPLFNHLKSFAPYSMQGGDACEAAPIDGVDMFEINGGMPQIFDASAAYNATITYCDGATTQISVVVFRDGMGETYVAPDATQNTDMAVFEAKPVQSLQLDSVNRTSDQDMHVDLQEWDYSVCFTSGTMILTPEGEVPVERLKAGDLVVTRDHGAQPLLWAGCSLSDVQLGMQPIRIVAGALGNGLPRRDLLVSLQHRILVKAPTKGDGIEEVLIPANKLTDLDGIYVDTSFEQIAYCNILCQRHEVVFAFGAQAETLYFSDVAKAAVSEQTRNDVLTRFPDVDSAHADPVSPLADGADGQTMVRELRAKRVKELQ